MGVLAAADPASLLGITDEVPRAPVPNRRLVFRNGVAVAARAGGNAPEWLAQLTPSEQNHATGLLADAGGSPPPSRRATGWY